MRQTHRSHLYFAPGVLTPVAFALSGFFLPDIIKDNFLDVKIPTNLPVQIIWSAIFTMLGAILTAIGYLYYNIKQLSDSVNVLASLTEKYNENHHEAADFLRELVEAAIGKDSMRGSRFIRVAESLESMSREPKSVTAAIDYLYERGLQNILSNYQALTNLMQPFQITARDQIELSRQLVGSAKSSIHFVDYLSDIKMWSKEYRHLMGRIKNKKGIKRVQIIVIPTELNEAHLNLFSEFEKFMKLHDFEVLQLEEKFLKSDLCDAHGHVKWRYEIYDMAAILRIQALEQYRYEALVDVTISDKARETKLHGLFSAIEAHANQTNDF